MAQYQFHFSNNFRWMNVTQPNDMANIYLMETMSEQFSLYPVIICSEATNSIFTSLWSQLEHLSFDGKNEFMKLFNLHSRKSVDIEHFDATLSPIIIGWTTVKLSWESDFSRKCWEFSHNCSIENRNGKSQRLKILPFLSNMTALSPHWLSWVIILKMNDTLLWQNDDFPLF